MGVGQGDIVFYRSSIGTSDGGGISAVEIDDGDKNDLWPDISDASRIAGGTRTKKWFMANEHVTDSLLVPAIWVAAPPLGITTLLGLGLDSADDDDAAQGNMTAFGANAVVALVSDGADTRQADIIGLDAAGDPQGETVTLAGAVEVTSLGTYSKVFAIFLSAISGSRTVLAKQGSGGTTRGTIGINAVCCWLWIAANSKAAGLILPDLAAGDNYGIWDRQTWTAGIPASRPTEERIAVEETA